MDEDGCDVEVNEEEGRKVKLLCFLGRGNVRGWDKRFWQECGLATSFLAISVWYLSLVIVLVSPQIARREGSGKALLWCLLSTLEWAPSDGRHGTFGLEG